MTCGCRDGRWVQVAATDTKQNQEFEVRVDPKKVSTQTSIADIGERESHHVPVMMSNAPPRPESQSQDHLDTAVIRPLKLILDETQVAAGDIGGLVLEEGLAVSKIGSVMEEADGEGGPINGPNSVAPNGSQKQKTTTSGMPYLLNQTRFRCYTTCWQWITMSKQG